MDRDEVDIVLDLLKPIGNRIHSLAATCRNRRPKLLENEFIVASKFGFIFRTDNNNRLLHVRPTSEFLSRVQPDRLSLQRDKCFFPVGVTKATALTSSGDNDGEFGHERLSFSWPT